jgi:hypothetical protein
MESDNPPLGTILSNQFIALKMLSARSTFAPAIRGTILGITRNVFDCIGDQVTSFFESVTWFVNSHQCLLHSIEGLAERNYGNADEVLRALHL